MRRPGVNANQRPFLRVRHHGARSVGKGHAFASIASSRQRGEWRRTQREKTGALDEAPTGWIALGVLLRGGYGFAI
jgi:hypothetical protein